jgi:hypothetical protein
MKKLILFATFLLQISFVYGQNKQSDFSVLRGPYLGQTPPGAIPEVFAPGVISTEKGWEAALSFSPDQSELFFSHRSDIQGNENRIMHMKKIKNIWTEPALPSFALDLIEYEAFITPDSQKVIFKSQRPKPNGGAREGGIWYAQKEKEAWSDAQYLPGAINKEWIMSVTSTLDGTLYFTGRYGIAKSRFVNGEYVKPEILPKEINKNKYFGASHPYIAPDESYLIFDAEGMTNSDLFISFRKKDGSWTDAIKLDQRINTKGYEGIATVSPDGKYLFFNRDNDIYWVSAKFIEELRPKE